ncbi:MAG: response regulator transcription factor [Myxococcales bacterium]|nr:response regulator transcription factor [Myxococcales bacterium]
MSDTSARRLRVLLADDHPVMVDGLSRVLATEADIEVAGVAYDVRDLLAMDAGRADVVVLDVSMPGMRGGETIAALRGRFGPVLLFTLEPDATQVVELVRAGAAGVVSKSARVEELLRAIRTVAAGGRAVPMALAERVAAGGEGWPHEQLSERELAIFQRLIRGATPKSIAFELSLAPSTVYTYAERIRQKLGVDGPVALVDYAHRAGLLGRGSHEG